jgi:transposase-like protein
MGIRWYLAYPLSTRHVAVKRVTRSMMGFKSFKAAQSTLTGSELMHMIRKGQMEGEEVESPQYS